MLTIIKFSPKKGLFQKGVLSKKKQKPRSLRSRPLADSCLNQAIMDDPIFPQAPPQPLRW
jgi:hypothetical protein